MNRQFKKVALGLLAHVTPSIFFSRILRSEALVCNSYFLSGEPFYGNYSTLDSHTNTVISHAGLSNRQDGVENRDKVYKSLQTTKLKLLMLGPSQTWNFLWVPNTYFSRWKYRLNTAVDSEVRYDGAEFNSVCCIYSQSLENFFLSNMNKGFYN